MTDTKRIHLPLRQWQMIKAYLEEHGFDGMYSQQSQCFCTKDQCFRWGREECRDCLPGYKCPDPTGKFEFIILPVRIPMASTASVEEQPELKNMTFESLSKTIQKYLSKIPVGKTITKIRCGTSLFEKITERCYSDKPNIVTKYSGSVPLECDPLLEPQEARWTDGDGTEHQL